MYYKEASGLRLFSGTNEVHKVGSSNPPAPTIKFWNDLITDIRVKTLKRLLV
jgi:hypothetical protein